jgi:hypothetical protein
MFLVYMTFLVTPHTQTILLVRLFLNETINRFETFQLVNASGFLPQVGFGG